MSKFKRYKLVIFVPLSHLEKVRRVVCNAGAGRIGNYDHCTFHTVGTGTFRPLKEAKPFKGKPQSVNRVKEARLETVVAANKLKAIIKALKEVHPYEEIAYDLIPLAKI
ncbi:hypothetical protein HZB07_07040 [Candidatus Saganbacteria bacterium]|nr:hypothetical protein [Candidatus Saganbacteria bacterium]